MTSMRVVAGIDRSVDAWHLDVSSGLVQAQVWPVLDIPLEWEDGTIEKIPARTRCLTLGVSGATDGSSSVDLTTLDYFVATYKGAAASSVPPSIVPVSALPTMDTLFGSHVWQLLCTFGRWGSRTIPLGEVTSSLPTGVRGDILYNDGTTWVVLHIPT